MEASSGRRRLHRRIVALSVAATVVASTLAGLAFARGRTAAIGTGVVVIETRLGYQGNEAAGTGIVLGSSGKVLTNNHVIKGATDLRIVVPGTGRSYPASVVGYDVADDVAVLKARGASNLTTAALGNSSSLALGQAITARGNAGGTGRLVSATGTITGLGKSIVASGEDGSSEELTGLVETDAAIEPGDSGGPLLDRAGRVVAMITAASASRLGFEETAAGDAYAIPIAKALRVSHAIDAGRASARVHVGPTAFLGVEVRGFSEGTMIDAVLPNGPADAAGLVAGDLITAVAGRQITTPSTLTNLLLTRKPGQRIRVAYTDELGAAHTAAVTLGSGPPQ